MPSRIVGNLTVAIAFAIFAVFVYFAREDTQSLPHATGGGSSRAPYPGADGGGGARKGGKETAAEAAAAAAAAAKAKAKAKTKTGSAKSSSPSKDVKDVKDDATGLVLPRTRRFANSKADLTCLGAGVRAKSLGVAKVNVYTVGLYVEAKGARGALKKYADSNPDALRKDKSLFKVLGQPGGFAKYLHLVFARSVGAQKVVDALTSVQGVGKDVLDRFSSITLDAVGKNIGKGESITLGWEGKNKMVILVRDKVAGMVVDAALPKAVFDLYLGSSPVSPAAKAAFAEGVPAFLAS